MPERTLLIIKPDAVARKVIGQIIHLVEDAGYTIVNIKLLTLTKEEAESFYSIHRGKPFFEPLINFMISGPCVPVVVEGTDVIQGMRTLVGATDPNDAAEGSIRKAFATDGRRNAVHASDSPESAAGEIAFFFSH